MLTIAQVNEIAEQTGYEKTDKRGCWSGKVGSHKYEVRANTISLMDLSEKKHTRLFYVSSLAELYHIINQDADYIRLTGANGYESIKNGYHTTYYVSRVY